jgi:hypothetical protein
VRSDRLQSAASNHCSRKYTKVSAIPLVVLKAERYIFGDNEMLTLKELVIKELENLNEEQLRQVGDFLAFIKFRSRVASWQVDTDKIATLYNEFAQEDRILAEEGLDEYAKLLKQED